MVAAYGPGRGDPVGRSRSRTSLVVPDNKVLFAIDLNAINAIQAPCASQTASIAERNFDWSITVNY